MKTFLKLFIYLAIIVIIAVLNNAGLAQAKSLNGKNNLARMDDEPEVPSEFESSFFRVRRDVEPSAADEGDIPKDQFSAGSHLRSRRQTEPSESDVPQGLQEDPQHNREKRQMPGSPGDMPMPPM